VRLDDELARALVAARAFADDGAEVTGVVPAEPALGLRVYLAAYELGDERRWLALDPEGRPVADRRLVREAVAVAALVELAEESAGGGDVGDLRARLVELRLTENPEGIDEAEIAAAELQEALRRPPRVASVEYLDTIGAASSRLEAALGSTGGSPFAQAMKAGMPVAEELADDVERAYKVPFA
jgi:hypothetical protein